MSDFSTEVKQGERFTFGSNWKNFLEQLDDSRIEIAKNSLTEYLELEKLEGKTFIDIGSGSGLFSLAARKLGAKVHSFDYDPDSVACTQELRRRYFPDDPDWKVEEGSALDAEYLKSLGKFDIVYSWGVLHHTGDMWSAIENAISVVRDNGVFFISIYNDQGGASVRWKLLKKLYNKYAILRPFLIFLTFFRQWYLTFIRDTFKLNPFKTWNEYRVNRGMSPWIDIIDWIGGYPFECAKPEVMFDYFKKKGFSMQQMKTCGGGLGCNEFVFKKNSGKS